MAVNLPLTMLAGHEPSADEFQGILNVLNKLVGVVSADCNSTLNLTSSEQDVSGCSTSVTVAGSNGFVVVHGSFDLKCSVLGTNTVLAGRCSVGGSTLAGDANLGAVTANQRASVSRFWKASLTANNATTVKLRALFEGTGSPTATVGTPHTNMTVFIFDVP